MHRAAQGIDERPVIVESTPRSISRETTFERDLHAQQDRAQLSSIFTDLCLRVAEDLQHKGYAARTIGIKLRFADFQTVTREITLPAGIANGEQIRHTAGQCLKRVPMHQKIRLLGVRAGGLSPCTELARSDDSPQRTFPF